MNERNVIVAGGLLGALAGAAAAYLFFTEPGRRRRLELQASLSDLAGEAERLLSAADQVRQSVAELRGRATSEWPRSA